MANKSIKQLEKEKNRSFFILAAFALAIGIALFFTGGDAKWVSIVFFAAAAALVAAGIIGIKKGPKYDEPGSPAALRHTQAMKAKADRIREKAHSHNSLADESSMRPMIISGAVFGVLALLNLGIWFFTGYIYIWLIIAVVIALVMFIIFLMNKDHKKLLKQFEAYGYDEAGAEEIFKDMALIRGGGSMPSAESSSSPTLKTAVCSLKRRNLSGHLSASSGCTTTQTASIQGARTISMSYI